MSAEKGVSGTLNKVTFDGLIPYAVIIGCEMGSCSVRWCEVCKLEVVVDGKTTVYQPKEGEQTVPLSRNDVQTFEGKSAEFSAGTLKIS